MAGARIAVPAKSDAEVEELIEELFTRMGELAGVADRPRRPLLEPSGASGGTRT
jgi:hypothetical protein